MRLLFLTVSLACAVFIGLLPSSAHAGGMPRPDLPDAQTLIEACWDTSKAQRESRDPAQRRTGFDQAAGCLEDTIMAWLDPLGVGEFDRTRPETRQELAEIRTASRRLYTMIYARGNECPNDCEVESMLRRIDILEAMLDDLIRAAAFHTGQWEDLPPAALPTPIIPDSVYSSLRDLPTPKALIDDCWKISLDDRSSINTSRMRDGHVKTVVCLKDTILGLLKR